ncbi:MAG TPA: 16S rRNA (guanine(527)-N(7))-methyltransferase RsmG [Jatrophihabitans sp.]|jgi:16S rRNA (guanine527-N7)-methyltransferase
MTERHDSRALNAVEHADMRAEPVAPVPPAVVSERLGEYEQLLRSYADWLAGPGTLRGLLGPREIDRLWERHILNSVVLGELIPHGQRLVDIGSGAGLPGLAVACVRPDLRVDLVDSLLRRTEFLTEVVGALGLAGRVRVIRGRAEDKGVIDAVGSSPFVTARAVAPLDRLARWALPLLEQGGSLLAIKGDAAEAEIAEHGRNLKRLGAEVRGIEECGQGLVNPVTRVVRVVRVK